MGEKNILECYLVVMVWFEETLTPITLIQSCNRCNLPLCVQSSVWIEFQIMNLIPFMLTGHMYDVTTIKPCIDATIHDSQRRISAWQQKLPIFSPIFDRRSATTAHRPPFCFCENRVAEEQVASPKASLWDWLTRAIFSFTVKGTYSKVGSKTTRPGLLVTPAPVATATAVLWAQHRCCQGNLRCSMPLPGPYFRFTSRHRTFLTDFAEGW